MDDQNTSSEFSQITLEQKIVLKIISRTPLLILHLIGSALGMLSFLLRTKSRKRSLDYANIAQIKNPFINVLISYGDFGRAVLEAAWIWINPPQYTIDKIVDETSSYIIEELKNWQAQKKSILFLGCHLGASEATIVYLKKHFNSSILYQHQKNRWLLAIRALTDFEHQIELIPMNLMGIRTLKRKIKNGEAVGISADQTPFEGSGEWINFFGKPAYTMMLAPKIALSPNCKTVFVLHLRTWGGYKVKLIPMANLPQKPIEVALLFNQTIEKYIIENPSQYRWAYNRYRQRHK